MQKRKAIAITDIVLAVSMLGLFVSGNHLHLTMKHNIADSWHRGIHIAFAIVFTISLAIHIWHHIGWFRSMHKNLPNQKKIINMVLIAAMLFEVISGIVVFLLGDAVHLGVVHHKIGILAMILSTMHFVQRHEVVRKLL